MKPFTAGRTHHLRKVAVASALVTITLLLAACSGTTENKNTFTLWYAPDNPGLKSQELWKKYNIDAFSKQYPKLTVNPILVNGQTTDQKQRVALAAGNGPDIITTPGSSNAIPYGTAGYLADLTTAATKNNWKQNLLPWALDMGYINGKLEALPTSYETLVIYYNKTLFDKNGWQPPTDRASLETLAGEMKAKGIIPFAAGNASYQGATEWLASAFMNEVAGPAKLHDAIAGTIPWTDPAFADSLKLLKSYFDQGYFGGGVKQYFSTQDPQKYSEFADGKAGMYLSGSWEMTTFPDYFGAKGNKDTWAWAPLPALAPGVPSQVFPLSVGGTISVNAHSTSKAAATDYLTWLFSDTKNMWTAAAATGSEPLPINFSASDVPSNIDPRYASQYEAINTASEKGDVGYVSWTSFGAKADAYLIANIDKVVNNTMTIPTFLAGVQKAYDADKKAGLIPPLFKTGK
jgi:raffinose/stachyose/melibiose transport system substrate-binding protein